MNEDCRKRGLSNKKILTVVAISTLLLSSGNVIATQTTIDGSLRVTEQLQTQIVNGLVVDVNGEPVIGASVVEKGTTNGGITDINGKFTLNVKPGSTLQISFVGYQTQEVKATKTVKVVLKEDSELLSEVVVVGYGTQKKANLTGAVATVDVNKTLDSRPIADIGRGLQGSVPGVNITIPTGEIGSDPLIKIRGQIGSISGNNTPLILLDNVEIPSIQMVNPNDVQSISVLKDAASSSIYGSKAAFGVILITTKSGAQTDKFEVSYSNGFWRISPESLEKAIEWQKQYGGKVKWNDPVVYGRDWYYDGKDKYGYRLYDAAKAMVRNWAPTMSHNLSVNGKSGKTSYNIGLGYLDQSGMSKTAKKDDFKRYNASVSVTSELNKYLTVRASSIYSDRNKRYPGIGNTSADPWLYMYRWSPLFPMGVTEHGNPLKEPSYEMAASNTDNLQNKYYNVNLGFTLNITKNWDVKFDYTYDRQTSETNSSVTQYEAGATWYAPTAWIENGSQVFVNEQGERVDTGGMPAYRFPVEKYYNSSGPGASQVGYQNKSVDNNTFNIYTTYNPQLGAEKEHAFKFMVGMNRVTSKWSSHKGWKTNLIDLTNPQFPLASGDQFIEGDRNWEAQLGFFGRLNYSFEDRYFLEANIRRDGSSKFPKNLQWRWFPSFSAGWVFTNESFMKPVENILSFGKFRASWGSIGDQTVSNTLYKAILADGQSSWLDGSGNKMPLYGTPSLVDSDISWQEIETLDFGVDLRFFKNKFGVTFDWYRRDEKHDY